MLLLPRNCRCCVSLLRDASGKYMVCYHGRIQEVLSEGGGGGAILVDQGEREVQTKYHYKWTGSVLLRNPIFL